MEFEFDKEIDGLLRQATRIGETQKNTDFEAHLDADEIVIFAENALPEKAKPRFIKHLADCDRCRTILSNTITLNSEAEEKAASLPVGAGAKEALSVVAVPWYKKLFATQNLAYGLGALALVFAGMLGFLALQNSMTRNSEMAKAEGDTPSSANVATAADRQGEDLRGDLSNSNTAATVEDSDAAPGASPSESNLAGNETDKDGNPLRGPRTRDRVDNNSDLKDAPDSQLKGNRQKRDDDGLVKQEAEMQVDEVAEEKAGKEQDSPSANKPSMVAKNKVARKAPPPPKTTPVTSAGSTVGRAQKKAKEGAKLSSERRERPEPAADVSDDFASSSKKRIAGKTFTRKNRVWYDSQYKGQKTTNVKRKTDGYRKLDSGLRTITDKLSGTVVVVWKTKAYRID